MQTSWIIYIIGVLAFALFIGFILPIDLPCNSLRRKREKRKMRRNQEAYRYVRGNVRLSKGLYRTPEEADKYIEESLKRPLP